MLALLPILTACTSPDPAGVAPVEATEAEERLVGGTIEALQGSAGAIVEVELPRGVTARALQIRAERDGEWTVACVGSTRCYLRSPADRVEARALGGLWSTGPLTPTEVLVTAELPRTDGAWWGDELPTVELDATPTDVRSRKGVAMFVQREDSGAWWRESTSEWTDRPSPAPTGAVRLPTHTDEPTLMPVRTVLGVVPEGWVVEGHHEAHLELDPGGLTKVDPGGEDEPEAPEVFVLDEETVDVVLLGRQLMWGDVHAHSDLSHDACKDTGSLCANTADEVGWGFFDSAVDEGLEFTAMTDHAEWTTWQETPESTEQVNIWRRQRAVVQDATDTWGDDGFVPVLGYEWTAPATRSGGHYHGGHRTVLLEDPDACPEARIAANEHDGEDSRTKLDATATMSGVNPVVAQDKTTLMEKFDLAAEACEMDERIIAIAHHPAWRYPAPVDWTNPDNVPDERYEMLVEIHSEHGASECKDPEADHCGWRPKSDADYVPNGSVQAALAQGFRFGFVGGTDSHDATPGTVDDDPSCLASWSGTSGELVCHDWEGALTGVLVPGEPGRESLFDGMTERTTYASSGPRIPVRAWAQTPDGTLYLPGHDVPVEPGSVVFASVEELVEELPYDRFEFDVLDASGEILATTSEPTLQHELDVADGDVRYVRLRIYDSDEDDGSDDAGERMWLSPWYFDAR